MSRTSEIGVTETAELCGSGKVSSRSNLERHLDAITLENDALHAFIDVFAGPARQRADELDRIASKSGPMGPLHGVPIAVKDLACIDGRAPGFGSQCYQGTPAGSTAPAIQRLIDAGAIIIGMTHMVEFASGGWGTNYAVGTPWNPIDRNVHRVPGGSSSGSAVAVAAGLVPAAIGSDTGGSIRIPASLCGIVGFKPSFGLVALDGVAPLSPTFDTLGPLTRTVGDARLLFSVLAQRAMTAPVIARPLRIGIPELAQLQPCDEEILEAFIRSVEALRSGGHSVETFSLPLALSDYQALNGQIAAYEAYRHHRAVVDDPDTPIDPYVRQRVLAGREIDDAEYRALKERLHEAVAEFRQQLGHFDIIATPSTPLPAIPLSEVDDTAIPMSRYTRLGNCLALCGISLPNGATASGLPTGLQLMSWSGQDALLLDFAEQVSAVRTY
jgi:aspartyl-tRNA(Asn)/glutamyl-tRNA(Gln) amidotransferase subunit A